MLHLHLQPTGQPVLQGNRRVARVDRQLDAELSVAHLAGDARHRGRHGSVLGPREAVEPQARVLAGLDAAERLRRSVLGDDAQRACGNDGASRSPSSTTDPR